MPRPTRTCYTFQTKAILFSFKVAVQEGLPEGRVVLVTNILVVESSSLCRRVPGPKMILIASLSR